jgi:hypothetical protein
VPRIGHEAGCHPNIQFTNFSSTGCELPLILVSLLKKIRFDNPDYSPASGSGDLEKNHGKKDSNVPRRHSDDLQQDEGPCDYSPALEMMPFSRPKNFAVLLLTRV